MAEAELNVVSAEDGIVPRSFNMTLRDAEIEVEFTDYGYEDDTNSHPMEWAITSKPHNEWELTDEEDNTIVEKIFDIIGDD